MQAMEETDSSRHLSILITGMVTASGGAWNASVMAEYSHLKDRTLETIGLGAQIDAATDSGRLPFYACDNHDLAHGGNHEPTRMAATLQARGNKVQARKLKGIARTRILILRVCNDPCGLIGSDWRAASFMLLCFLQSMGWNWPQSSSVAPITQSSDIRNQNLSHSRSHAVGLFTESGRCRHAKRQPLHVCQASD